MSSRKSPGGSTFPYYYMEGELFGAHYEGFERREGELLKRMQAEEEFFMRQNHPLPYWVNLYGTKLSGRVVREFIQSMKRMQRFIPRLAIVGCSKIEKWRLEKERKRAGLTIQVEYFIDPENAKAWLVGKIHY